jgi:hypothetical protein
MSYIEIILKGIITGILTAYLLVYGLRPSVPYPDIILEPFENNWLFIILFIINYYLFLWDLKIGLLMLLSILALLFDLYVFTLNGIEKKYTIINNSPIIQDTITFNKEIYVKPKNKEDIENFMNNSIYDLNTLKENNNNLEFISGDPASFI